MRGAQISFRPFVELSGVYDTGLAGVGVVDTVGNIGDAAAEGLELSAGISGAHQWRHTTLGLDYHGSVRHYTTKSYYDGLDQSINLGITHQMSRRMSITLRETAGSFTRDFGLAGLRQAVPFDPSTAYIPRTDFFDNRTLYVSSQVDLTYQKTARLSFNIGGDVFTAKRRSAALFGITGESGRGDIQYRLGRYTTFGGSYNFTRFSFSKAFGDSNIHSFAATYAVRFTRNLELSFYGGASQLETKFVQLIPLDPAVAAIIGESQAIKQVHRIDWLPNAGARLSRNFHNGVVSLDASHGVTPGNGLFLTSSMTSVNGTYAYTGLRRWSAGANGGYQRSKGLSNVAGHYGGYFGGMNISRKLVHSMHVIARFDARQYSSGDFSRYNRLVYRATIGFGFAPGDVPLRVW